MTKGSGAGGAASTTTRTKRPKRSWRRPCTCAGPTEEHAARLARELNGRLFSLDRSELRLLELAYRDQSDGHVIAGVTVQTCWDADRLDLGRGGKRPNPRYLCTEAAQHRGLVATSSLQAERNAQSATQLPGRSNGSTHAPRRSAHGRRPPRALHCRRGVSAGSTATTRRLRMNNSVVILLPVGIN